MNLVKLDIIISEEVDSLVEKVCTEHSSESSRIELLRYIDMENSNKINCMLYKLGNYDSIVIIELIFEELGIENKKVYSKSIISYSELYVPMIEVFNNTKYIINFKFDSLLKPLSFEDRLKKITNIYSELDSNDMNKIINVTNFKNTNEKLLLALSLLIPKKNLSKESIDKFDYYGYSNYNNEMVPMWIWLDFEKNAESFIEPLMIYTHMYITGINDDLVLKKDIIKKAFKFYNDYI